MKFQHRVVVGAARHAVYAFLTDVPRVATCVPGVSDVATVGDDRYRGTLQVNVGPMRFRFMGEVAVVDREPDRAATLRADGKDASGGVRATMVMTLADDGPGTAIAIASDVQVMGRLGELGQPVMKRKADDMVKRFGANLERALVS